ncbi:hypothetical protein, partial [Pseudomonas syringae]|uniref:hypothetical protein n=1 Tax=Pseudomonas syringae TaxID=317 RepID=UPI001C1179B1
MIQTQAASSLLRGIIRRATQRDEPLNTALYCPLAIAVCIAQGCTPILRILFIVALNRTQKKLHGP